MLSAIRLDAEMSGASVVLAVVLLVAGLPAAAGVCHLLLLVIASRLDRQPAPQGTPRSRLLVLVPAHNEAAIIASCVSGLLAQRYPEDLRRVVVIADNCEDTTAAAAVSAGAEVWERRDPTRRGKGYALRWAFDRVLAEEQADALVVVDADARTDPDLLRELESSFAAGSDAVQADYVVEPDSNSPRAHLEAAAVLLRNRVRFAGLQALGLSGGLSGSGMLFSRGLLQSHPWEAFSTTEDSEYGLELVASGVPPFYAGRAHLVAPTTPSSAGAHSQGVRWEGGRFSSMISHSRRLLEVAFQRRQPLLLLKAWDAALPPFTTLGLIAAVGTISSVILAALCLIPWFGVTTWAVAIVLLPVYVFGGLWAAGASRSTYLALLSFPLFIYRKLLVYAHVAGRRADTQQWVRTERRDETGAPKS
ncbi:MAG TPA: glycosyltransferase family 2 protein [Candidatus Dormibacteraeota bacterium]|nr:glycosyltransferase family 2 protein [Candidatus Dormibacteraeota bacterium]